MTTLYEAIGGDESIASAVEIFYERVLADPLLRPFFTKTPLSRLKAHQQAFLAQALGGPVAYTGLSMREAHQGRDIADAHFDRIARHLADTLASLGAPEELVAKIIAGIEPLRTEIVTSTA